MKQIDLPTAFYFIGKHSILIALALIFSYPFFWMLSTSAKVDREMFSDDRALLPIAPRPVMLSPYIADDVYPPPTRPERISKEDFTRVTNALSPRVAAMTDAVITDIPARVRADAQRVIAKGLWQRVLARTP